MTSTIPTPRAGWLARGFACAALAGLLGSGCMAGGLSGDVEIAVSEHIPTVATVEWDTADADRAFVEFGPEGQLVRKALARVDDTGRARATLIGMKPLSDNECRIVEVVEGDHLSGAVHAFETGSLDVSLPSISVEVLDPERANGGFVITSLLSQPSAAIIIDADGDVVWVHQPSQDWRQLHVPRALRSRVGDWIVYLAGVGYGPGEADLVLDRMAVRLGLDGADETVLPVPDAHHDLVEQADGGLAVLMHDWRTIDGQEVQGDRLVEVALDGTQRPIWSAWDHFDPGPLDGYSPELGWTHANAVDYVKEDDAYLVSLHNLDCIVKIDRETGELLWILGGESSDFVLPGGSTTLFQRQHEFEVLDGGIVVFDNGLPADGDSRVVEYLLDEEAGTAEQVWEYRLDPPQFNVAMGDVDRLPNGNTLVTWSALGQIDEVTPDGTLVWRLNTEMGSGIGYTLWRETLFDVVFEDSPASP